MADLTTLIEDVKHKFPHLKRVSELLAGRDEDLKITVLTRANSISDASIIKTIDDAMNTNVGIFGSLTGNQGVRDLARLAVLLEAVKISAGGGSGYGGLAAIRKSIVDGNNLKNAEKAVQDRLDDIQRIERAAQQAVQEALARKLAAEEEEEFQRRIVVLREVRIAYETRIGTMADTRVNTRQAYENFASRYTTSILDKYTDAVLVLDQALNEVDTVLQTAKKDSDAQAAFKREVALFLFKAVRKYAPPPFNLAGAIVEAGAALVSGVLSNLKDAISADVNMTVSGAALGKAAMDAMQKSVTNQIQGANIPRFDFGTASSVKDMLLESKRQAIDMVGKAVEDTLEEAKLAQARGQSPVEYRNVQADHAKKLVSFEGISRNLPQILAHTADSRDDVFRTMPGRLVRSPSLGAKDLRARFEERMEEAVAAERTRFDQLRGQLEALASLTPPGEATSPEFKRLVVIFLYAIAIKARMAASGSKKKIPVLEKNEIAFLSSPAVNLITTVRPVVARGTASSAPKKGQLPIFYDGSYVTRYALAATLLNYTKSAQNPFNALFSSQASGVAAIEKSLNTFCADNTAYAEAILARSQASGGDSFQKSTFQASLFS